MIINTQTVLVVDDESANIELLNEILGSKYEVLFATSGQDAIDIALHQKPDLILLDIVMPELNGYEVCARLKADTRTKNIPIIFITAMGQDEDEAKGLKIGAIDYITKPIRPLIVQARVRNHLELKSYRDFLENLSGTDGLTGIANRRRLDESIEREWRRCVRAHSPISLILMDVDLFKAFNDHYSHLAGDDCLREIARGIDQCARRPTDLVARYGGEEFACLLPDIDMAGSIKVAERIMGKIESLKIPHEYSFTANYVTMSIGVAAMIPEAGQVPTLLIQCADQKLYEAKRSGRNQIRY
jgi:diguanylate cyclase (GGDEF)-like protein